MLKHIMTALSVIFTMTACSQSSESEVTIKGALGNRFLVGTALNMRQIEEKDPAVTEMILKNFNAIVAENCMKSEVLSPAEDVYDFEDADRFVAFGEKYGLAMTGHVLIWHSQCCKWFFTDAEGNDVSRDVLIGRMRKYIFTVLDHFRGKMKGWDVVNEAFLDNGDYRPSKFYQIIGPDFIEIAFQLAYEADPDVELYYNDYSMSHPGRRNAVINLVRSLKEKGCRIDAIGMQSHVGLDYPDLKEYEETLQAFAAEGVRVMATELDMNVLPSPDFSFHGAEISQNYEYRQSLNPYTEGLPDSISVILNKRYGELMDLYARNADVIDRVTFWGVTDGDSWLNGWPVRGRTNYPLPINRDGSLKPFVTDFARRTAARQ